MDNTLYDMIPRRKSFHKFKPAAPLTPAELEDVLRAIEVCEPLLPDIRTRMRITTPQAANCLRGEEHCVMFYSEHRDGWLQNAGYMVEQLDLMLTRMGIGTLWYGMRAPAEKEKDGLEFVITLAFGRAEPDSFRKDMYKAKRKTPDEIMTGEAPRWLDVARFAPSACNSQPWRVETDGKEVRVYRSTRRAGIIPASMLTRLNGIDMGIFLCFAELCMAHEGLKWERTVVREGDDAGMDALNAVYSLV